MFLPAATDGHCTAAISDLGDSDNQFVSDIYTRAIEVEKISLATKPRLMAAIFLAKAAMKLEGDFVEAGVFMGGTACLVMKVGPYVCMMCVCIGLYNVSIYLAHAHSSLTLSLSFSLSLSYTHYSHSLSL